MVETLLATKFHIPPVPPQPVRRERLIAELNKSTGVKLTLISAPAGFGKTTLVSMWARQVSMPVVWLSLDKDDNDLARFLAYIITAFQKIQADIGKDALAVLHTPQSPSHEIVLTSLLNDLAAIQGGLILVLDDYHLVQAQRVHEAVIFLLDHLPLQTHLLIASRADPPLPLPRLRARGQLIEIRQSDLRFTAEEAAAFLNKSMGLELTAQEVAALDRRTEGWIAGLQMAALSLQGHSPHPTTRSEFIQAFTGSHRFILDYLVEEVLEQQPPALIEFLLKTSILERLSGPLCDAVLGDWQPGEPGKWDTGLAKPDQPTRLMSDPFPDSQSILEHLEASNLFIIPMDDERLWYRYHRLFSDLLGKRLRRTASDLLPALHLRASRWYRGQGFITAAIHHSLAAGDYNHAAQMIEQAAEATMMRSEMSTLLSWIEMLPEEVVCTYPLLCVYHAWALLFSSSPLEVVEARLKTLDEHTERFASRVVPLKALIALFRGDIIRVVELSHQALANLSEEDVFLRGFTTWLLSVSRMYSGDWETGRQALDEVATISQHTGNVMVATMVMCNQAELYARQGQPHKAAKIYQQALEYAVDGQGQRSPIASEALLGLGELSRVWNDLEAAERYLTEGIELSKRWSESGSVEGHISLAYIRQARGDFQSAQGAIQKAWQLALNTSTTELDDILVEAHQARLWILAGNIPAAEHWALKRGLSVETSLSELENRIDRSSPISYRRRTDEYLTLVRLLIVQGRCDEALTILVPLRTIAEKWGLKERVVKVLILKALAFQVQDDLEPAMAALLEALSLAEPAGYVRLFVDEGVPMARLLYEATSRGMATNYAGQLLAAFPASEPAAREPRGEIIEPLSDRELDVLRLLAAGMSNPEIAEELYVATSTVSTHCKSIYNKLNVHKRWDAVERARQLGLV